MSLHDMTRSYACKLAMITKEKGRDGRNRHVNKVEFKNNFKAYIFQLSSQKHNKLFRHVSLILQLYVRDGFSQKQVRAKKQSQLASRTKILFAKKPDTETFST